MSAISDVITFRSGKALATAGEGDTIEILQADAEVAPGLQPYLSAPVKEFAFEAMRTRNPRT